MLWRHPDLVSFLRPGAGSRGEPRARWGACLLCRLPTLPLALPFAPIPPPPSPSGEGGDQGYFMQGAPPLASPRLSRRRHGLHLRCRCPLGCLPGWSPTDLAVPESVGGACPLCRLPPPAFSFAFCPHPPNPRSQSALPLRGRGRPRLFHARGSAPCIPAPEPEAARAAPAV